MDKAPQTIADELTRAINALLEEGDRYTEWNAPSVLNLRRSIDQLQKVDARRAFISRGLLAAICGNVEELLENYRKALLHPDPATTKHEIWGALGNLGLYSEAQEVGTWLLEPRRGFYQRIWQKAVSLGQVLAVWDRLPDAKRAYPDLRDVDFSLLERTATVMRERNLRDDDVVAVFRLMGEIQRAHRIMFAGQFVSFLKVLRPPDDPPYLYFAIPLDVSVGEVRAMNRELAALVVKKLPHGAFPQGLVTSFTKAPGAELRAAA